jgi:hypothetical protein
MSGGRIVIKNLIQKLKLGIDNQKLVFENDDIKIETINMIKELILLLEKIRYLGNHLDFNNDGIDLIIDITRKYNILIRRKTSNDHSKSTYNRFIINDWIDYILFLFNIYSLKFINKYTCQNLNEYIRNGINKLCLLYKSVNEILSELEISTDVNKKALILYNELKNLINN